MKGTEGVAAPAGVAFAVREGAARAALLLALAVAVAVVERVAAEAPRAFGEVIDLAHRLPGARLLRRC